MIFDASTLFVVIVAAAFANASLLGWSWWQNRSELSLLWMCVGFGVAGVGNLLFAGRETIPELWSIDLANGLIVYSLAMIWVVVRTSTMALRRNGRPPPVS